ncbi:MAG TPA: 4-hydroxy-3-methylbut-2-enyl diphosphate reductase [Chthoniobacterales bacterium]|nr:4-hydroxy-3-methylbut-2-enyl diphosphate reductase [Chthoniobacterales bacterium]
MKVILAQHFGVCFGVRDAIAQAKELAREGPLTILGELVHNPVVHEQLREQGVDQGSLDDVRPRSHRVMITAHGASDRQRRKWRDAGYDVADATCPLVQHAHEQLKRLVAAGYFPVVIGKPGHVEVRGLTEDFSGAAVVEKLSDLEKLPVRARYGIISQTTQPIDQVRRMVAAIRHRHRESEVVFVDTVCRPTKERQTALGELIDQADVIVVVGGHHSNNTRQLVQTCRLAGRTTFHVERPEELQPEWFIGVSTVGLTAGTSTLPETIGAVHKRLLRLSTPSPS